MKFIHTADWQIGMRAAHVGAVAEVVRGERLNAAQRVVDVAREKAVAFIVVAGDMFQDNGVERVLVQQVADILGAFAKPVYIIPGNHDPFVPGSVWEHPAWKAYPNITILVEPVPVEFEWGKIYPCPLREKHSFEDPTQWIKPDTVAEIRIGIAHGTVEGVSTDEPDYPIPRDAAVRTGLDYLALGHWHSTATYASGTEAVRMAYSGTHETSKFGERDSGNVLLVEIEKAQQAPVITPINTGGLVWETSIEEITQEGDLTRFRERLEQLDNGKRRLVDIRLGGVFAAAENSEIERLSEIVASRFLFGRVDTAGLRPRPGDDRWVSNLPIGPVREAGARLCEWSSLASTMPRPEGAKSEVATQALLMLYQLANRGSSS